MRSLLVLTLFVAACANGGGTAPVPVLALLAGDMTHAGDVDGTGAAARFDRPWGVVTDSAGNIYVSEIESNVIRKITPAGVVTTLAGKAGAKGSTDGTGVAARFDYPSGISTDGAGNVYVADFNNYTIRKITPAGVVTTLAGKAGAGGSIDGTVAAARFEGPLAVATDSAGNLYVADLRNTIRKITSAGVVTTLAGTAFARGSIDGTGAAARFGFSLGIATDSAGNVYVSDDNHHIIRKITPVGVVTTFAGTADVEGNADGTGVAARFKSPRGLAVDSADNVYVADYGNSTIRKITPAGVVRTVVGVAGQERFAPGALPGRINLPSGVAVSGTSLYISLGDTRDAVNGIAVVRNRP